MEILLISTALGLLGAFAYLLGKNRLETTTAKRRAQNWKRFLQSIIDSDNRLWPVPFERKRNEQFVLELREVSLAEPRRGPRVSQRRTDAITVALAKGLYYTAAGGKSISHEPEDVITEIDRGIAYFTTSRVVFVGSKQSREWSLDKVLGSTPGHDGLRIMIAVSNRQKISGIASESIDHITPEMALEIATRVRESGWEVARELCREAIKNLEKQEGLVERNPWINREEMSAKLASSDATSTSVPIDQDALVNWASDSAVEDKAKRLEVGEIDAPLPVTTLTPTRRLAIDCSKIGVDDLEAIRRIYPSSGPQTVSVELRFSADGGKIWAIIDEINIGSVPDSRFTIASKRFMPGKSSLSVSGTLRLNPPSGVPSLRIELPS